jgi:acid stress-induced BolA-like protein IbaG/YrbA
MTPEQIQRRIEAHIPEARVEVEGGEGKFAARVVSPAFEGLSTVKRHQMVYAAVNDWIADGSLHALSIQALTPHETG